MVRYILDAYKAKYQSPNDNDRSPFEQYLDKEKSCMKSGTKYTDDHGHSAIEHHCCGCLTDSTCLEYRIKTKANSFGWMNNGDYIFKIFFNLTYNSPKEVDENAETLIVYNYEIKTRFPKLWYRLAQTNSHIIFITEKKDEDIVLGDTISFEQFIAEYVDYTKLVDLAIKERFVIDHKFQHRILGQGAKPKESPKACNRTPKKADFRDQTPGYSLKRVNGEIIMKDDFGDTPVTEYRPIEQLVYAVDDKDNFNEPITLDFKTFLKERIQGNYYEEWEEFHGVLEGTRLTKYLYFLYEHNEKDYGFIKENEHFRKHIDKIDRLKQMKQKEVIRSE